jgi:hypothetical protein
MKKAIIYGYFIGMSLLTYFMFHLGVWISYKDGDFDVDKENDHLTRNEAKKKGYDDYNKKYWDEYTVQYTFVKKPLGYEIQKDTINVIGLNQNRED